MEYETALDRAERQYPKGSWISFMRDSRVIYGEVMYHRHKIAGSNAEVITTVGVVSSDMILEVRKSESSTTRSD